MRRRLRDSPVLELVRAVVRASGWRALLVGLLVVAAALLPVALTIATGSVVGAVPAAAREGSASPAAQRLLTSLVVFAIVYVAQVALAYAAHPASVALGLRFALYLREQVLAATSAPVGIEHLEDPDVAEELGLIENVEIRQALSRSIVPSLLLLTGGRLLGIGQAAVLFAFAWWAPLVIGASALLTHRWLRRDVATFLRANELATSGLRRSRYLRDVAVGGAFAKEVRVFGLGPWAVEGFASRWREAMGEVWRERGSNRVLVVQVAAASALAYGAVFFGIGHAALDGRIGLGAVAAYSAAAIGMMNLAYAGDVESLVRQGAPIIQRALRLDRRIASSTQTKTTTNGAEAQDPRGAIRFEGVDFAYPGASDRVLLGLDLEIPVGRSLAIVGENGAGKTTLIKLLVRLHDPTRGRITVDGVPISELDPSSWRSRMAVIFQDFVRYELSLRDNVGFGALRISEDLAALGRAVEHAGAGDVLESVGWDKVLSRAYEDGVDLSGGQWQKVALARAMAAVAGGASVLVLDEPTANLDVRAEAELFDRFLETTRGLTTILVSHRFSTVRRAERICVIEGGRAVESGSHEELMMLGGRYATMFRLQADRFTEDARE